ncbi:MAG: septal ring lytic transglycosylase RlpA family protein [Thermodesulfobacteriota bacterium]
MKISPLFLFITFLLLPSCASIKTYTEPPIENGIQYGVASWYGDKFHGRPTASGVIYDMYGISAAHKTLPLGTIVRVKNIKNGKEIEVVINDRGPFVDGRILDFSFGAAEKVDMVKDGLTPIRLEIIGRDPSYIKGIEVGNSDKGEDFVVQVGSFTDHINADRLKTVLEWGYGNVHIEEAAASGTTYYRVRIGPYTDRTDAMKQARRLAEEGYNVWVTGK